MRRRRQLRCLCAVALALLPNALSCAAADRGAGEKALIDGRLNDAVAILSSVVASTPKDGKAHLFLCRAYYAEEVVDESVKECEAALANGESSSSDAHDWMGRAYGAKASKASFVTAIGWARKVVAEFERAVALDPTNAAAANDLSEFYVNAPALVGGGPAKATALADKVQSTLPQAAHRIRALVADEKRKTPGRLSRSLRRRSR